MIRALASRLAWPRGLAVCLAVLCLLVGAQPARAIDRRAEAAAKEALGLAAEDHAARDDDGGLLRLQKARRVCSASRCSPLTTASLLRDIGAFQFGRGEHQKASTAFADALDLAPNLEWNAIFAAPETVAEWAAVKAERAALHETPPRGDLDHTPEAEQAVDTGLPIYAESSITGVAQVVVKYRVPGERELKRITLPHFGGGWGGTIPCQDVKRGLLRYFLQAFDASGAPLGNAGDVKHLYFVPIRWAIAGDPPHLPGQAPPVSCNGVPQPAFDESAVPGSEKAPSSARFVRWWLGVSGAFDMTTMPSATNVCALAGGTPVNASLYCTSPSGADFPARSPNLGPSLVAGKGGDIAGGIVTGDVRVLATLDYAVNASFMTGARIGYVAQSYPGAAASTDGHGIAAPIHVELRETYLFGTEPLAHAGFAPYAFAAVGYAKLDASELSSVTLAGVRGSEPVTVWKMGGPFFAALGIGARYAFSPRVAFLTGLKAALPFGSAGVLPSASPEAELQYGF